MTHGTRCPENDELRQLLGGTLSSDRQQECTDHMDSCAGCQSRLENLAVDGTNLSQVIEHLDASQPVAHSAYWPALSALERGPSADSREATPRMEPTFVPQASVPETSGPRREVPLDFLEPATDSAYLGRLANFDVMRVLGRGGMGVVLEAFDSRLQRNVALKVLDPELAGDDLARQRFCREARAAASITHENVVAVHQVERSGDDGLPYLVMQLIAGESLEQRLARERPLSFREIVRIGMQAAQGLAAAHAQGMIHRDVKPGNILLESSSDRVKLTDFGLAHVADDVKLTRTGFVSGTPLYMSPEQALGEPTDHRSDLFSLGAVLYEMCTGSPPFAGNSALAILKQIADGKHKPLRELNPSIPHWFAEMIDRLLSKKADDRIQSAAHLAELLEYEWALLKTTSDDVPAVCAIEERKRKVRSRWIALAIGTTFLALGLGAGWLMFHRQGGAAAVSSAEPVAVLAANAGAVWSVAFDPTGNTVAMAVEDGSVRLWDLATRSIQSTFTAHGGVVWGARYFGDGKLLATAGDDGLIKLWKLPQAEVDRTFEHPNAVRGLTFAHHDQRLFAGSRDGTLRVWSPDSREPLVEARQPGAVYALAISPDDETLASAGTGSDKVVWLWNAKSLTQKLRLEGHAGPVFALAFHRDGRRLASVGWDKTIRIWDTGSGLVLKSWEGHESDIWSVAFSPDGTKLATGGTDGAVKLWNAETGELLATFLGHKSGIHTVAFNHDGTRLASGGRDGAVRIWEVK